MRATEAGGKRILAGVAVAAVLLSGTACGKAAEKIGEKAAEKAMEEAGGGNVDIDSDDGSVDIKTEDGSLSMGAATELPDEWPAEVELLDGAEIVTATTNTMNGTNVMSVSATFTGDLEKAQEATKAQLEDAGFEISGENITKADGGGYAGLQATNDTIRVGVTIMAAEGDDSLISYTVQPADPEAE